MRPNEIFQTFNETSNSDQNMLFPISITLQKLFLFDFYFSQCCNRTFKNTHAYLTHLGKDHDMVKEFNQGFKNPDILKCPKCPKTSTDYKDYNGLLIHFGIEHQVAIKYLNELHGIFDCYDDSILQHYVNTDPEKQIGEERSENINNSRILLKFNNIPLTCPICKNMMMPVTFFRHLCRKSDHFLNRLKTDVEARHCLINDAKVPFMRLSS